MKSKDLMEKARTQFAADFLAAVGNGDENAVAEAVAQLSMDIQDALLEEANDSRMDAAALTARGVRILTSAEEKYYKALGDAMMETDAKTSVTNLDVAMPETIIDAVMEDISSEFPLLDAIDFRNSTYMTKWFYNTQGTQMAAWNALGSDITKELSGSIDSMNMTQCKLTAYMVMGKDFLQLGPVWLDRYIRAILAESNGLALESAVVDGDGDKKPIGMTRDLDEGKTAGGATTYERKEAIAVAELGPETYGSLLSKLTVTPSGRRRAVKEVLMVVNPADYLMKVMPSTTILTPQGTYVSDVLPFPTKIVQSVGMPEGKAALGLPKRYFAGMGTSRKGVIQYSDHVQFLEDNRVYTTHLYGNGRPLDNNAFLLLDISGLKRPSVEVTAKGWPETYKTETAGTGTVEPEEGEN